MAIIRTRTGDALLAFEPQMPLAAAAGRFSVRVSFAVMIARHRGQTLFVYNPWRQEWELPAGAIHEGETPDQAAIRELYEEAGQQVSVVQYAGLCLLGLPPDGQHELGAAYTCIIEQPQPFITNDESSAMTWWDPESQVDGYVNALARWLALHVR